MKPADDVERKLEAIKDKPFICTCGADAEGRDFHDQECVDDHEMGQLREAVELGRALGLAAKDVTREALEQAKQGIVEVSAAASLAVAHTGANQAQREWLRNEVRSVERYEIAKIEAALAAKPQPSTTEAAQACARCDDFGWIYDPGCSRMVKCHCGQADKPDEADPPRHPSGEQNEHARALSKRIEELEMALLVVRGWLQCVVVDSNDRYARLGAKTHLDALRRVLPSEEK